VDIAGESQLVGYPTQFPSVSMMDWKNGKPNARFQVLKLLKDNFGPGDRLVETNAHTGEVTAQAFITTKGKKLLLINKRDKPISFTLPATGSGNSQVTSVDVSTGENPPETRPLQGSTLTLKPYSVSVVQF
jgi:hypothetical protein